MDRHEQVVRRFRRRVMLTLTLRYVLTLTAAWCFAWGAAVLVARGAVGVERQPLVWGLLGLVPAAAGAVELARRRLPAAATVRAMVDRRSGAGGLLMAREEAEIGGWRDRLPAAAAGPALRWRGGRAWGTLFAAAAFVAVGFLVPVDFAKTASAQPLRIGDQAGRLNDKIRLLKEERIIDDPRAEDLREKLERVRAEARADDPVKTWESLDHLEKALSKRAEKAAEDALNQTRKLSEAQSLAEGIAEDQAKPSPAMGGELTAEAMSRMAATLKAVASENRSFKEALQSQNFDADALKRLAERGGKLTPEQASKLANLSKQASGDLKKAMRRLSEARMIDKKMLAKCESAGKGSGKGLAKFLNENEGKMSMGGMMAAWAKGGAPGRGGTSRGRGDAPMTWQDASDEGGTKFQEKVLPPSSLEAFKDSARIGVSRGAPKVVENPVPARGGALSGAQTGGGSASKQTILPRHRDAVRSYFKRE